MPVVDPFTSAGREKDRLFLATHREALESMLSGDESTGRADKGGIGGGGAATDRGRKW